MSVAGKFDSFEIEEAAALTSNSNKMGVPRRKSSICDFRELHTNGLVVFWILRVPVYPKAKIDVPNSIRLIIALLGIAYAFALVIYFLYHIIKFAFGRWTGRNQLPTYKPTFGPNESSRSKLIRRITALICILFCMMMTIGIWLSFANNKPMAPEERDRPVIDKNQKIDVGMRPEEKKSPSESDDTQKETGARKMSNNEAMIAISVLVFGLLTMIMQTAIVWKSTQITDVAITRIYAITLILIGAIFLIITGYSSNQIAPAFGLMGSIAGYLLGANNASRRDPGELPATGTSNPGSALPSPSAKPPQAAS